MVPNPDVKNFPFESLNDELALEVSRHLNSADLYHLALTSKKNHALFGKVLSKYYGLTTLSFLRRIPFKKAEDIAKTEYELLIAAQSLKNDRAENIIIAILENNFERFKKFLDDNLSLLSISLNFPSLENLKIAHLIAIFKRTQFQEYVWQLIEEDKVKRSSSNSDEIIYDIPYIEWCVICNQIEKMKLCFKKYTHANIKLTFTAFHSAIDLRNFFVLQYLFEQIKNVHYSTSSSCFVPKELFNKLITRNDLAMLAICVFFERKKIGFYNDKLEESFVYNLKFNDLEEIYLKIFEYAKTNSNITIIQSLLKIIIKLDERPLLFDLYDVCLFKIPSNQREILNFFNFIVENQDQFKLTNLEKCLIHLINNEDFEGVKILTKLQNFSPVSPEFSAAIKFRFLKKFVELGIAKQETAFLAFAKYIKNLNCSYLTKNFQQSCSILLLRLIDFLQNSNAKSDFSFIVDDELRNYGDLSLKNPNLIDADFLLKILLFLGTDSKNVFQQLSYLFQVLIEQKIKLVLKNTYNPSLLKQINTESLKLKIERITQLKLELDSIIENYQKLDSVCEQMFIEILAVMQNNPETPKQMFFIHSYLLSNLNTKIEADILAPMPQIK